MLSCCYITHILCANKKTFMFHESLGSLDIQIRSMVVSGSLNRW